MTSACRLLFTLMVPALFLGCSNYPQPNQEMADYHPPVYAVQEAPREPAPVEASKGPGFQGEEWKLREAAARWEQALRMPREETTFFSPPSPLLESLQKVGADATAAAAALTPQFCLEPLETLALIRNPGIKAGEDRVRAAIDIYSQVMALDAVLRQYTAFTEALMNGIGPVKGETPIDKKFPFPGVLSLKGEIVNQDVKIALEDLEIARRNTITRTRKAYWDLLFARRAKQIVQETLGLFQHLEEVAAARYRAGETSYQDVVKVRIERDILEQEVITWKEKQKNTEAVILELLRLSPDVRIGIPRDRPPPTEIPSLAGLYPLARERRQELVRLRARVGKMERLIEMAETQIMPPFTLGFSYFQDDAVTQVGSIATRGDFSTSTTTSTGFGLPKNAWYGVNDAYIRQTRQALSALREDLREEEDRTDRLVRDAWYEVDLARRQRSLFQDSVTRLSKTALEVSTKAYETGRISFADVIASYRIWLDSNMAEARWKRNLGIAWAMLQEVAGTSLPQNRKAGAP